VRSDDLGVDFDPDVSRAHRDLLEGRAVLPGLGKVVAGSSLVLAWLVLDRADREVQSISSYLRDRALGDVRPATCRSYAYDLLRWFRVLWLVDVGWEQAEYRQPTPQEWNEFDTHFDRRRVELGSCGRPYGTGCTHEHAPLTEPTAVFGQVGALRLGAPLACRRDQVGGNRPRVVRPGGAPRRPGRSGPASRPSGACAARR
jgi:hypothetical protein